MPNVRMLPPPDGLHNVLTLASGRTISAAVGSYLDMPVSDAQNAGAAGWTAAAGTAAAFVGTTAQRPTTSEGSGVAPSRGQLYLDTTLGYVVVFDGALWRNPANGAAV